MTDLGAFPASPSSRLYWRRIDPSAQDISNSSASLSWFWWPALLLVFLYGLLVITPNIEADIRDGVAATLARAGHDRLEVKTSGQHVLVEGVGMSQNLPADMATIHALARGAVCDVWVIGTLICPAHVHVSLHEQPLMIDASAPSAATVTERPDIATNPESTVRQFHNFSIVKNDETLTLRGAMPSADMRDIMLKYATSVREAVIDELSITANPPSQQFAWAVERAWSVLAYLKFGEITWSNGLFSVSGEITSDNEQAIRAAYQSRFFGEHLAGLNLDVTKVFTDVATCDRAFSEILNHTPLEFEPQSASLLTRSAPVLARLTILTQQCTLDFVIEGHTSNNGTSNGNMALSIARAESVMAALIEQGINPQRLSAVGYGATQAAWDNATPRGRMLNRRITIKAQP